jgi:hypothetical protein
MEQISFCGTVCTECPAFLATQKDADDERREIAELWSKQYNAEIKPEDVNCDGCLSEGGRLFFHCNVCEVRRCGQEKGLKNCAYCDEYACAKLMPIFELAPQAKATLDEVREKINVID